MIEFNRLFVLHGMEETLVSILMIPFNKMRYAKYLIIWGRFLGSFYDCRAFIKTASSKKKRIAVDFLFYIR